MGALIDDLFTVKTSVNNQTSNQFTSNYAYDSTYAPTIVINSPNAGVSPSITKETRATSAQSTAQSATPSLGASSGISTTTLLIAGALIAGVLLLK